MGCDVAPLWVSTQIILTSKAVAAQEPKVVASEPSLGGESLLDGGLQGGVLQAGALWRGGLGGVPGGGRL